MDLDKAFSYFLCLIGLALVALTSYTIIESIRSNGEVDYCYIEMVSPAGLAPQFKLHGHRPWRFDSEMGAYLSVDEAKAKADLFNCKMNVK